MEFSAFDASTMRLVFPLVFIAVIIGVEWMAPFRTPIQSKLEHVSTNLIIFGGNSLVQQFLAAWALLLWSSYVTAEEWGLLYHLRLPPVSHVVVSVILLDLFGYGIHRLNHRVPFLWRFHRAHHSDLDMDATTSIRFHLGEVVITTGLKGLGVWALGVPPIGFIVSETVTFVAGLFSHGNVRLPVGLERGLRLAIVTPAMHWIHHSRRPAEHNTNLGAVFSGWDRMFGTYYMGVAQRDIHFGLDEYPTPGDVSLLRFSRIPFDKACRPIDRQRTVHASTADPVKASRT